MTTPYATASSGASARDDITKVLRRFGAESIGFLNASHDQNATAHRRGAMKAKIDVADRKEATLTRALVKVMGALKPLASDRARIRVMRFVEDALDEWTVDLTGKP